MSKRFTAALTFLVLLLVSAAGAMSPSQNERLVVGQIKRIYDAQAVYSRNYGNGSFGGPGQLWEVNLLDATLVAGRKYGYVFTITTQAATAMQPARFFVTARPQAYRKTGIRSFYMSSNCLVTGADKSGSDAGPSDPLVDSCTPTIAHDLDKKALIGMRVIHSAQATYQATVGNGNYGTHGQLVNAGFLMNPYGPIGTPALGQIWSVTTSGASPQPTGFKAFSRPLLYRETGIRSFFVDEAGVIRGADRQGAPAQEDDPPVDTCSACAGANELTAKYIARFLFGSEYVYATTVGNNNFGTLSQLAAAGMFYLPLDSGVMEGYVYTLNLTPSSPGVPARMTFTATPLQYGVTGVKSFYIDETGVLRGADKNGAPADANDPPVLL